jgi:SHS family lactate transporter-like MFS transporter
LTTCWFQAAGFVTYYSINALFATHLQKDLGLSPALIATPLVFANLLVFFASSGWGWVSDRLGRRPAMIIPALCAIPLVPIYLFSGNFTVIVIAFVAQGIFAGGGMYGQVPSYLTERFPTEIRGTATGFCYHVGAIPGAMVPPILTFFAAYFGTSLAIPMLIGTLFGLANFILSVVFGPETKGTEMVPDLVVA